MFFFFFSSRRRHTRSYGDWSSDVCSSDLYLNPNSVAHLSLALDYPNDYDRTRAAEDGRDTLGGDIMIHGGSMSSGCVAIGDEAAEELFVLAADAGWRDAVVVLSPVDFRRSVLPVGYRA